MLKRHQRGFSLVELMVGLTISLFVLMGISSVYLNTSTGSRTTSNAARLNQDLRAVMDIMVNDIRRAGYWGTSASGSSNPFATATTIPTISQTGGCILYAYDATYAGGTAGVVDAGIDFFGFRLSGGALQTLDQANSATLNDTTTSCTAVAWQNLTDERAMTVTALTLDTVGSQCIAFVPATYSVSDSTTYQQWTTAAGSGEACSATASGAPTTYPSTATNTFVETRQINITLAATSKLDPSLSASLTDTALVRNNRVIFTP